MDIHAPTHLEVMIWNCLRNWYFSVLVMCQRRSLQHLPICCVTCLEWASLEVRMRMETRCEYCSWINTIAPDSGTQQTLQQKQFITTYPETEMDQNVNDLPRGWRTCRLLLLKSSLTSRATERFSSANLVTDFKLFQLKLSLSSRL